jgi:LPXTG-motif cell wall-anchored protein
MVSDTLIIAGVIFVLMGLLGLAFRRRTASPPAESDAEEAQ